MTSSGSAARGSTHFGLNPLGDTADPVGMAKNQPKVRLRLDDGSFVWMDSHALQSSKSTEGSPTKPAEERAAGRTGGSRPSSTARAPSAKAKAKANDPWGGFFDSDSIEEAEEE